MPRPELLIERLRALKALGVQIAIDDFGTGYSSLSYLRRLPVDKVKIDRSFVGDLDRATGAALVRGIISLTRSLGHASVAEGIETAQQAATLAAFGCEFGQGYYFGRPVPAGEAVRLLAEPTLPARSDTAGATRSDEQLPVPSDEVEPAHIDGAAGSPRRPSVSARFCLWRLSAIAEGRPSASPVAALAIAQADRLQSASWFGELTPGLPAEIRPARMDHAVPAHGDCRVVADEDALQRVAGDQPDAHELDLRILRLRRDPLDLGAVKVGRAGGIGVVQADPVGIVGARVERYGDPAVVDRDRGKDLVSRRPDPNGCRPVPAVGRADDERIAVALHGVAGGVELAVAVVGPRDVHAARRADRSRTAGSC